MRKDGTLDYLRPDGKTQVTVRYDVDEHGHRRPSRSSACSSRRSTATAPRSQTQIKPDLIEHVIEPILQADYAHLLDDAA